MQLITALAKELNKSESEITKFLVNAPVRYKVYTIPKRTSGHRVIAQPEKELKEYQRAFLKIQSLPIHDAAMAYRIGLGIKDNANKHKHNCYLLKLDIENFFNSITSELFWKVWQLYHPPLQENEKMLIERLLFWSPSKSVNGKLILSIGAPSSPLLSNFFMYLFDKELINICNHKNITYTRYADDLTFSTNQKNILCTIPNIVKELLNKLFEGVLNINRKKTIFSSKAHNRHVTGITLNNHNELSLGRRKKRYIKHLIHQYELKKLTKEDTLHLKGILSFIKHIEPQFLASMEIKHSKALITQIFKEKYE